MSFDELKSCKHKSKRPYVLSFIHPKSKAQLVYYGCEHQNPTNATNLEKAISDSLEKFNPTIIAIEGIPNSKLKEILESSTTLGYEADYAIGYYRKNKETEIIGFEDDPSEEVNHLQNKRYSEIILLS